MIVLNDDKLEQARKAIKVLQDLGLDAKYIPDYDMLALRSSDVLGFSPETATQESAVKAAPAAKPKAVNATKGTGRITVGDRIRQRNLGSIFERQSLRRAGSLAKNVYRETHGKSPSRNAKKTFVYEKSDIGMLDEVINTMVEQISSEKGTTE